MKKTLIDYGQKSCRMQIGFQQTSVGKIEERGKLMRCADVLTKEMFESIVAFSFSEPGAMGANGTMMFYRETSQSFTINYLSEEISYSKLKICFLL